MSLNNRPGSGLYRSTNAAGQHTVNLTIFIGEQSRTGKAGAPYQVSVTTEKFIKKHIGVVLLGKTQATLIVAGLFLFFFISGCDFNQETRDHALARCDSTSACNCFYLNIAGNNYDGKDTILVKVISHQHQSDTLTYSVFPRFFRRTQNVNYYYAELDKEINIHSEFLIVIPGEPAHKIKNIKLGVSELNAIGITEYKCVITGFDLDGKVYKDSEITIYCK